MSEAITLQSLVGEHLLSGVSDRSVKVVTWGDNTDDAAQIAFILDGVGYAATEDPDDGYRSSMGSLAPCPTDAISNTFEPQRVLASVRTKHDEYGGIDDVLEFRDVVTGKVVLEVGTADTDDWYPYFVGTFTPENMAINQKETA